MQQNFHLTVNEGTGNNDRHLEVDNFQITAVHIYYQSVIIFRVDLDFRDQQCDVVFGGILNQGDVALSKNEKILRFCCFILCQTSLSTRPSLNVSFVLFICRLVYLKTFYVYIFFKKTGLIQLVYYKRFFKFAY